MENVQIKFGLEQQGHISTIEKIIDELGFINEHTWEEIGKEIGWCPQTACYHYMRYLRKELNELKTNTVSPLPFMAI